MYSDMYIETHHSVWIWRRLWSLHQKLLISVCVLRVLVCMDMYDSLWVCTLMYMVHDCANCWCSFETMKRLICCRSNKSKKKQNRRSLIEVCKFSIHHEEPSKKGEFDLFVTSSNSRNISELVIVQIVQISPIIKSYFNPSWRTLDFPKGNLGPLEIILGGHGGLLVQFQRVWSLWNPLVNSWNINC